MLGGASATAARKITDHLELLGLHVVTTGECTGPKRMRDADLADVMATCAFAVSTSGVSLYDLLASGIPTIALAANRLQLRTAMAFEQRGAAVSAGLLESVSADTLLGHSANILKDPSLARQLADRGQELVDGKGLSRVVEIVRNAAQPARTGAADSTERKESWPRERKAIFTNC
jgi:hypothetical protein